MNLQHSDVLEYLAPVAALFSDTTITEISVNPDLRVFVERAGKREEFAPIGKITVLKVEAVLRRIAHANHTSIDDEHPILNAQFSDGSRICAVYPPASPAGPMFSIRRSRAKVFTLADLLDCGSLSPDAAALLARLVNDRQSILISGGTGTGKTTFVNALAALMPLETRVCLIEKPREIVLPHVNVTALEATHEVSMSELVQTALRLYPDRIIVGEVRGSEAADMLQALNTGHAGSFATIHANSAVLALSRLASLAMIASGNRTHISVLRDVADAIQCVVQLRLMSDGSRVVSEIVKVLGYNAAEDVFRTVSVYSPKGGAAPEA